MCLGFISAIIVILCFLSGELRPQVVEALLMLPSQALLLLLCHLDNINDLVIVIKG